MRVNTNVSALIANNQMGRNVNGQSKSMEKLSSGVRIKRVLMILLDLQYLRK